MSDTITLPREVVEEVLEALEHAGLNRGGIYTLQRTMLRTALAAEQPVPTVKDSLTVQSRLDAESFREERDEARALLNGVLQDIEALRRDAERYREQKERSYRLQRLLKECVKVMQANAVFRDTKAHKDLKTRIRAELENKR